MEMIEQIIYFHVGTVTVLEILVSLSIFLIFIKLRKPIINILFKIFGFFTSKTKTKLDDRLLEKVTEPMKYLVGVFGLYLSVSILNFDSEQNIIFDHTVATLVYIGLSWILFVFVDVFAKEISRTFEGGRKKIRSEMVNFIIKFLKTVVVLAAVIVILGEWEYNVSAVVASLGLGGLAFALAAKDTVANLFGSMMILWDKPFEHGEWIVTSKAEGTVVEIGLRSTTIRTFANALVTVPNGTLANETITNWSKRKVGRRIKFEVGLLYSSEPKNIKKAVEDIKEMLFNHKDIAKGVELEDSNPLISKQDLMGYKDTLIVNVDNFGPSSINILVYCFTNTVNWFDWLDIKEDVMFRIMEILKANELEFAFPSQSLYIEKQDKNAD